MLMELVFGPTRLSYEFMLLAHDMLNEFHSKEMRDVIVDYLCVLNAEPERWLDAHEQGLLTRESLMEEVERERTGDFLKLQYLFDPDLK